MEIDELLEEAYTTVAAAASTNNNNNNDNNLSDSDDDYMDDNYYGDSNDDGSEAELHDVSTDFHFEELTIDDLYGVDFVKSNNTTVLKGAPAGWSPPGPPDGWQYIPPKGSPAEADIDNPGGWNLYSFAPKMGGTGKKHYEGHFTPAGAKVLPANESGVREVDGWKFYYDGWHPDTFDIDTYVRDDAKYGDLKPSSRNGCLDVDALRRYGVAADRLIDQDALLFFQMIFPICDPTSSGIDNDNRMPYFTHAAICTNIYAASNGAGSGVGHDWKNVNVPELVRWTGIPIYNGALDGKAGSINSRWDRNDARFDPEVVASMTKTRFKEVKRNLKLNNNMMHTTDKDDAGYDPCAKYDMVYKVLVHNMNNVTRLADLDNALDESTWGFAGYTGPCGNRLINKPFDRGRFINIHSHFTNDHNSLTIYFLLQVDKLP